MWVLALDTTTRDGSVAVVRDDTAVVVRPGTAGLSHAERVPADLREVLNAAGVTLSEIDLLAVASGPGAFTGLRIGLAAMQGLAMATGTPVIGVPALEAWAWALLADRRAASAGAWLDASRGEVFAAAFAPVVTSAELSYPLVELAAASSATPVQTLHLWRTSVPRGTAIAIAGPPALAALASEAGYVPVTPGPLAPIVGRLAARAHRAGHDGAPSGLAPVYVRRPDVEIERDRRRAVPQT